MRYVFLSLWLITSVASAADESERWAQARRNGERFEHAVASMRRLLYAWMKEADPKTLLLPEYVPGHLQSGKMMPKHRVYTPHNPGADLYPYLVLTAQLTDPYLFHGPLRQMLRNEILYTNALGAIPADLDLDTGRHGPPSLFGAGEYAKDGLLPITEYLGRTPWFDRLVKMVPDAMTHAPVHSRFGMLPDHGAELNGDFLQVLVRLESMTGEARYFMWARRIADAYMEEVLPGTYGLPAEFWDFDKHQGNGHLRLRDHGNELVVGLVLQYVIESDLKSDRAQRWRPGIARMLDRILESAQTDGMLYNSIDADTLKPIDGRISDNWGYVYGAMYAFYQCTGDIRYRDAVRKVLGSLPMYCAYRWEPRGELPLGSFDGYADAIESAIYLVNREPVAAALPWIESEMDRMMAMQKPDGHVEYWYAEGNYNRTAMLYALMKSQGARPRCWEPGVRLGAVRDGDRLFLSLDSPRPVDIQFDFSRHSRFFRFTRNYVRLNEFPEWFTVDGGTSYRLQPRNGGRAVTVQGSDLIRGVALAPGDWTVERRP